MSTSIDGPLTAASVGRITKGILGRRTAPFLIRQVMSSPPTVAPPAAATAIGSAKTWPALSGSGAGAVPDPLAPYLYLGAGTATLRGTGFPEYNYVKFMSLTTPFLPTAPYGAQFWFDGTTLEIAFRQLTGYGWQLLVDGQLVAAAATASSASPGQAWLPVTFGSRKMRLIEFRTVLPFLGAVTGPADTISKPTRRGPRFIVIGDSYTSGTGATVAQVGGFVPQLGDLMGWSDTWNSGVGSTGYLAPGSGVKLRDRLDADVIAQAPDVVLCSMGHNDTGFTNSAVGDEAGYVFGRLRAQLPNALLYVSGPLFQGGLAATYTPMQAAIFAATAPYVDGQIDTCSAPWFTGTGRSGATAGNGNSDYYIGGTDGTDTVHPTQAGHDYLAVRFAEAMAAVLPV